MPNPNDWQHHNLEKPKNDDEYFERMTRTVMLAGLNWATLEKKWPGIKEAFYGLEIEKVAKMNDLNIARLMANPAVIRNRPKIEAIVQNAREFQAIADEYGSFEKYLVALRKEGGEAGERSAIAKRFAFLGPSTATIFLHASGEELPEARKEWEARHK